MSGPDDPTRPPPRRRRLDLPTPEVIDIPRPAAVPRATDDGGHRPPSERTELALRQAKAAQDAVENLVARVEELREELAERDRQIQDLQQQLTRTSLLAMSGDGAIAETMQRVQQGMVAQVTAVATGIINEKFAAKEQELVLKQQVLASATQREAGEEAGRVGRRYSGLGAFLGAVLAGAVAAGVQMCAHGSGEEKTTPLPAPAVGQPVKGAYGSQ